MEQHRQMQARPRRHRAVVAVSLAGFIGSLATPVRAATAPVHATAVLVAAQDVGSAMLVVRPVVVPTDRDAWFGNSLGDPLPAWSVAADGTRYRTMRTAGSGLFTVRRSTIGAEGVSSLRSMVHDLGLDEPEAVVSAPPTRDDVQVVYLHASGRYAANTLTGNDPRIAPLLGVLERPNGAGSGRPEVVFRPTVLRAFGREAAAPAGQTVGAFADLQYNAAVDHHAVYRDT